MFSNKLNYKIINITALMLLLYIGFSNVEVWWNILQVIISVFLPFIVAFAFAYAITPVQEFLINKGMKKPLAVLLITISVVLLIIALLVITLPLIYDQLILLSRTIMEITADVGEKFNLNLGNFEIKMTDQLNSIISSLGNILSKGTINVVNKSINFIGKFVVGFIAWIYFLSDMQNIKSRVKNISMAISNRFFHYIKCLDDEIGNYIKGLAIFMVIQLVEYSFLFWLVGHPNWLLLGILACVTTVIPYFGGLITNIIGIITALVVSTPVLIGTIIICIVFPQLDGYVISPKIYGKTNNVDPLVTIMAVSVGGSLAGIIGIVIALPVFLLLRSTYNFYKKDLKKGVKKIKKTI